MLVTLYYRNDKAQTIRSYVEKARTICLMSESVRMEMEQRMILTMNPLQ